MSFSANTFLSDSLEKRKQQNNYRRLVNHDSLIDFCSNDYLGFAQSLLLKTKIAEELEQTQETVNGSAGSRLLSGNSFYAEKLEARLAQFHQAETGLLYNSGYDANQGLISAVAHKGHTVLIDELIHASVHDGIKLSRAEKAVFKHNDVKDLEEQLKGLKGVVYVAIETIYSMDGDEAPLGEIIAVCKKYKANLIVDEAHATGITKNEGKGLVQKGGFEKDVFARVHTFGKGMGCQGAVVLGSNLLRDFLINYSRSFIYTTALPLSGLIAINQSYNLLEASEQTIAQLHELIDVFQAGVSDKVQLISRGNESPIQSIIIEGNKEVKRASKILQDAGYDVRPIVSPTVPKGEERLRICIHAFNSKSEVEGLYEAINTIVA